MMEAGVSCLGPYVMTPGESVVQSFHCAGQTLKPTGGSLFS